MDKDWALVVGINCYPNASGLATLSGAVRDAQEFYEWVTDPLGGAVPFKKRDDDDSNDHARLLITPNKIKGTNPSPGLTEIYEFFEKLQNELSGRTGRRLYIFLSGHGISPVTDNAVRHAALVMANSRPPRYWPNFPGSVWAEGARSSACFREVVLIMDCCRDLQDKASIGTHIFGEPVIDATAGHLVEFYAAEWGTKALEGQSRDGGEIRGIFTHSLLEVLRAGKMNGRVLKDSVVEHLRRKAPNQQGFQNPDIQPEAELPNFIFNEAAEPPLSPVTILNHAQSRPMVQILPLNARRAVPVDISNWQLVDNQWQGSLPPGSYEVRMPQPPDILFEVYAGLPTPVDVLAEEEPL